MELIKGLENIPPGRRYPVLSVGNFDGVHLAHQHILAQVVARARERGEVGAALTFDPHPLSVVAPERCPPLLTTLETKVERLGACGIGAVLCARFTREMGEMAPQRFIREVLAERVGAEDVFVGFNFRFGKDRAGNPALVQEEGARYGLYAHIVSPFRLGGERVSSSRVRQLILNGEVEEAARFLGRPHLVPGRVVRGTGRGERLGIPTANLSFAPVVLPAPGVYAGWARAKGERRPAVINLGRRPTFGEGGIHLEAHLLDFEGDLYGQPMELEFAARLRPERRFESPEELVGQIRLDIQVGRKALEASPYAERRA